MPVSLDEHAHGARGRCSARIPNALLEVANEPTHPDAGTSRGPPEVLLALAARVPAGRARRARLDRGGRDFARSDYATWHAPRDNKLDGWAHVLGIAQGAALAPEVQQAGRERRADRRRSEVPSGPARRCSGAVPCRSASDPPGRSGCDVPLRGRPAGPNPAKGASSSASTRGTRRGRCCPADVESQGTFAVAGAPGAAVREFDRKASLGVFERIAGNRGWVLAVGPGRSGAEAGAGMERVGDEDVRRGAADYGRAPVIVLADVVPGLDRVEKDLRELLVALFGRVQRSPVQSATAGAARRRR